MSLDEILTSEFAPAAEAAELAAPALAASAPPARDRIAEIIVHSEAVVQILGVPPHWLVRRGSTAMVGVVGLLVLLAWLIHYPDTVPAGAAITMKAPPALVVAQANGHLETLVVRDGDKVQGGEVLARVQNSLDPQAAAQLQAVLAGWHDDQLPPRQTIATLMALPLGELQGDCAAMARTYSDYTWHLSADPIGIQIRTLAAQRAPLEDRIASLQRQRVLMSEEVALAERGYQRMLPLTAQHEVSLVTLDDRQRIVLAAKRAVEGNVVDEANTRLELDKIDQAIVELNERDQQQRQDLMVALRQAVKTLGAKLATWDRTYVLRAPIAGRVSLSHFWTDSQFIHTGDEVMAIVPAEAQVPFARISLPISRAGLVKVGQTVFIRLDNYPGEQFGLLKGRVIEIAPVPLKARFAVTVALPDGLVTTFGRRLTYQQEMQGQAEIIAEDLRVIDRIFYQFRRLFRQDDNATRREAQPPDEFPSHERSGNPDAGH
jgi:multidrug resistance efflux pump